ncbi:MAG: hypothetical protein LBT33_10080 [Spirochaetia bacterium]|jgi:hypothetical protein|nr:hypothetical protein [Spirochaetia bacterium]
MNYAGLPPIRRARDYHLYDRGGRRYLDLCLAGGRALLGHKPRGLYKILKNEFQKGLAAEFPTAFEKRFEKALLGLAPPGCTVRLYASFDSALGAAGTILGRTITGADILEPFFAAGKWTPVYYRPFTNIDYSRFSILFPVLPFPGNFAPQPLLLREQAPPPGDAVSPLLLAGLARLAEELKNGLEFPDMWKEWRLPGWKRFGCYCFPPLEAEEAYARAYSRFLEEGIVLSPQARRPSILPRLYSPGERRLVERLSERILGSGT